MLLVRKSVIALVCLAAASGVTSRVGAAGRETGGLKVTAEYKGAGTVDKTHQIYVWVFDTPNITAQTTPLASDAITTNGGSVSFSGLPKTVYLAAAFNEKGDYDSTQGPPPTGTPVTIYGGESSAKAVETGGADAAVTITFDDSMRMP
jgi:uncharacterized protein (DUF2141 family)